MSGPLPETDSVRAGGSARIGAVIVAIALIAIVGVGLSGRQTPAPNSAIGPAATPAPTLSGTGVSNERPVAAVPTPTTAPATAVPAEAYGASLAIGNVRYVTVLSELEPGHLTGELHFPSPPLRRTGTFAFSELRHDRQVERVVAIDEWTVDLDALANATRTTATVVEASVPPQSALLNVPSPVARGYDISVAGINDLLFSRLFVDVTLAGDRDASGAKPTVRFGVAADEGGIHGAVILSPGSDGSFEGSFTLPKPRRAVTTVLRLYNVQVSASHDIWSEIQQFPIELTPQMAKPGVTRQILDESYATFDLVVRTSGNARGQSITVTAIAHRFVEAE
jgi:hypothetical protein